MKIGVIAWWVNSTQMALRGTPLGQQFAFLEPGAGCLGATGVG